VDISELGEFLLMPPDVGTFEGRRHCFEGRDWGGFRGHKRPIDVVRQYIRG
jgi:hypothetical protein